MNAIIIKNIDNLYSLEIRDKDFNKIGFIEGRSTEIVEYFNGISSAIRNKSLIADFSGLGVFTHS